MPSHDSIDAQWRPDTVIFHHPCDDGHGAALAVWLRYRQWDPSACAEHAVAFVGAKYGDTPPDVTGKNVLIADFSYKEPVLREMAATAKSIVVLDHHKTAEEALSKYSVADMAQTSVYNIDLELDACGDTEEPLPLVALFDMDRSGARMTWDFFFPGARVPLMIDLLQDRDLWRFDLPETKAFTMYLRSIPMAMADWHDLIDKMDRDWEKGLILANGEAILRYHNNKVRELLGQVIWGEIGGHKVPVINANWCFSSDLGHELLQRYPDAPFAATYFDRYDSKRQFSLRSDDSREDVGAVAKLYGGGGHRNAAGFEAGCVFHIESKVKE
jgi:hypothetical protein